MISYLEKNGKNSDFGYAPSDYIWVSVF